MSETKIIEAIEVKTSEELKDDILKAAATVCAKDKSTQELIKAVPMMHIVFELFAEKIVDELFGEEK